MADEEDNSEFPYTPPGIGHNQGPEMPEEDPVTSDKLLTLTKLLGSRIQPMALPPEERKGQQGSRPTNLQKLTRGIGSLARKSPLVSLARMGLDQIPVERRQQVVDYLKNATTPEMFSQGLEYFKDLFSSYNTGGIASLSPEDIKQMKEKAGIEMLLRKEGLPLTELSYQGNVFNKEQVEDMIQPILEKLPENLQEKVIVYDRPPENMPSIGTRGFYYETGSGKRFIGLIANRLESPEMVEMSLLHELYGHMGLSEILTTLGQEESPLKADKLEDNLLRIYEGIGGMEGIKKYAPEGFNIEGYLETYKQQNRTPEEIKSGLTEELFSWIAGDNNPSINRYVNEITGSVRNWMREKGFTNLSNVNKPDLLHILKQSRRTLQRGGSLANKQPSLTLSKTPDLKSPGSNWPDIVPSSTRNVPFFKKAEGGFIDGPLYDNARMIG